MRWWLAILCALALPLAALARPLGPERGAWTGANLDWASETVADFNGRTAWDHVCFVDFTEYPSASGYGHLDEHIEQVLEAGGVFVLTAEPAAGLGGLTSDDADTLAGWCAWWNGQGVPIIVRFAHEMNGDWYAWGMRPATYRAAFQTLAGRVHALATNTATLWAPNDGGKYPFGAFDGMTQAAYLAGGHGTTSDWALLDTDVSGVLQAGDDPYAPFYPGDEAVDWVGITLYHWGTMYPWLYNTIPEARKFADLITGNYNGPNGDQRVAPDFYAAWAEGHGKPMMISETAAYFRPGITNQPLTGTPPQQSHDERVIKAAWMDQVFHTGGDTTNALDVATNFPLIKAVNWFNHYKRESEAANDWINWTVISNASVRGDYRAKLAASPEGTRHWQHAADERGQGYGWDYSLDQWSTAAPPFAVAIHTQQTASGRGCLRVTYTPPQSPYGVTISMVSNALAAPRAGWATGNAIHVRARVLAGVAWASVRLVFLSGETGWDVLGVVPCAPDGGWHTLVFPYDWSRHDGSAWLNLALQLDLPTSGSATVDLDALSAVVDSNTNGVAAGYEADDDSDGMDDAWESAHGLNPRSALDALPDADGDRVPNYAEWIAGTDPGRSSSFLAVQGGLAAQGALVLTWSSVSGVTYTVRGGLPGGDGFSWSSGSLPATPPSNAHTVQQSQATGLYAVEAAR